MKKTLLLAAAFCAMTISSSAQVLNILDNVQISKVSNDGKLVYTTDMDGNAIVVNLATGDQELYEAGYDAERDLYTPRYFFGFGRGCSDSQRIVGAIDECTPGYLENGTWTALPMPAELLKPGLMSQADDITPDNKRICGVMAGASFGAMNETMVLPCYWEMQADGSYSMPIALPHPELDFTGRAPQYITARAISADGKTIVGQLTDYSGFYIFPIVYRQDAEGNWSYDMCCNDMIYNKDAQFPLVPEEPEYVNAEDYMDDAAKAAWAAALAQYDEEAAIAQEEFMNGNYEYPWPEYPEIGNYVSDKEAYQAAMDAYNTANDAYQAALNALYEMWDDPNIMYGPSFEFNTVMLSADGRYMSQAYFIEGEPDPDAWFPSMDYKTIVVDLQNGNAVTTLPTDYAPSCFLADNTLVLSSPASAYSRDSYLWKQGDTEPKSVMSYWETASPEAASMYKEEMTFDGMAGYDEEWNPIVGDKICKTGTCVATPDAKVWVGWLSADDFVGVEDWYLRTFALELGSSTGIDKNALNNVAESYVVTNMAGLTLYRGSSKAAARQAMQRGVNIFTVVKANGKTESVKINKK